MPLIANRKAMFYEDDIEQSHSQHRSSKFLGLLSSLVRFIRFCRVFGGKRPRNITDCPPYLTMEMRIFTILFTPQLHTKSKVLQDGSIVVSSDHRTWSQSKCQPRLAKYECLYLWFDERKGDLVLIKPSANLKR